MQFNTTVETQILTINSQKNNFKGGEKTKVKTTTKTKTTQHPNAKQNE